MDHMELPHRHGNNEELSRLEHCMQEAESFQAVAGLCRLLSDANRVRIFWLLCHCEECVVNLAALVGMSSPAASHHLRQLKDSGLVVSRRIGKEVYYRAADTEVAGLLHHIILVFNSLLQYIICNLTAQCHNCCTCLVAYDCALYTSHCL